MEMTNGMQMSMTRILSQVTFKHYASIRKLLPNWILNNGVLPDHNESIRTLSKK